MQINWVVYFKQRCQGNRLYNDFLSEWFIELYMGTMSVNGGNYES
jgi:hypothetical protein